MELFNFVMNTALAAVPRLDGKSKKENTLSVSLFLLKYILKLWEEWLLCSKFQGLFQETFAV